MFNKERYMMALSEDYPGMLLWYKILKGQKFTQEEWDTIVGTPNAFPKRFRKSTLTKKER